MSERPWSLLIEDIQDSLAKIETYTKGFSKKNFIKDTKTVDAVVRNLEIIGEAANRLPIDLEIIWQILQKDIPAFKTSLLKFKKKL